MEVNKVIDEVTDEVADEVAIEVADEVAHIGTVGRYVDLLYAICWFRA